MRLLVVVAHPDDESFGCGSVLARAAAAGDDTTVVCATRGEAGESRLSTDDLAALRESELRAAAAILGVRDVRLLDHADSGMNGDARPGTLAAADPSVVRQQVQDIIEDVRPDVAVTLDGSDGHRDHVMMRDATLAAVDAVGQQTSVYLWCLARSSMQRWADHVRGAGTGEAYLSTAELGTPDEAITTVVDVTEHLPTRWAAIRAHASQSSPYDDIPPDLQRELLAVDRLRLVRGRDVLRR